jgi:Flp pilus assembly protein TadG
MEMSMKTLGTLCSDRSGNVAVLFALATPVALTVMAMAVSYSAGNSLKAKYQASADAAVLAAAGLTMSIGETERKTLAENTFFENLAQRAGADAIKPTLKVAVTMDSNVKVAATADGSMENPFGGIIGGKTIAINAAATAIKETTTICVLGLNGSDKGSFDVNGNPTFKADCAVQANTTNFSGMTQEGKVAVKARKFGVTGRGKVNNYVPPPEEGTSKVADPYASVPFPTYDDCSKGELKKDLDIKTDTTLEPGTYCGGIHINSTAKVTLKPGNYVMVDGPFWVNGSASVTGSDVMIAFTGKGSTLQVWGDASVNVTSPKTGTYTNFQFFQDRSSSSTAQLWVSIGGSSGGNEEGATKLTFDGTAYFPTQNFWVFGNSVLNANSPGMAIVADKVWTQGNATFTVTNKNPRGLAGITAPQTDLGVRLIQ